jgi:hypothetical protein
MEIIKMLTMMKKNYLFMLLPALLLAGCAQDMEDNSHKDAISSFEKGDIIAYANNTTTRTALNSTMQVVWSANDEIRMYGSSNTSGAIYSTTAGDANVAVFKAKDKTVDDLTRYAVYPASATSGNKLEGASISISLAALATQNRTDTLSTESKISELPMTAVSNDTAFVFRNTCGGIRIELNNSQMMGIAIQSVAVAGNDGEQLTGTADVDLSTGAISLAKASAASAIVSTPSEAVKLGTDNDPAAHQDFVVFLPAVKYDKGLTFTITDTAGRVYTRSTNADFTVEAGIVKTMQMLPITLYYGKANCYLASAAGTLSIDVAPYYTLSPSYTYENNVRVNAKGETVDKAVSAKTIWTQTNSTVTGDVLSGNPTIDGTTLKVPVSGAKGNALVGICDAAGNVLWSFHIWVSDVSEQTYKNDAGTFVMLDRNLGATSVTPKDQNAYGLFYQWGRKDPFPRPLNIVRSSSTSVADKELTGNTASTAETGNVAYAVGHPDTRILAAGDWLYGIHNNAFWGNGTNLIKTVYDPSPEGYCVPPSSYFSGLKFTTKAACDSNYGHLFVIDGTNTSYYPTCGYLDRNANKIWYQEYRGYLWTSNGGSNGAYYFYYNNSNVATNGMDRAIATCVRCIKLSK